MEYLTPWERYRKDMQQYKLEAKKAKQSKAQAEKAWQNSVFYKIRQAVGRLAILEAEPDAYIERTLSKNISFIRDVVPAYRVNGLTYDLVSQYREGPMYKAYTTHYIGEDSTIAMGRPDKYGVILEKGRFLKKSTTIEDYDRYERLYGKLNWLTVLEQLEKKVEDAESAY